MSPTRPRATVGTEKADVPGVIARAHLMYAAFVAAILLFPSPSVAMAAFLVLIQNLEGAQTAAATKAKGLSTIRDSKRNLLWTAMESLRVYVQGLADGLNVTDASALILLAGLLVANVGARNKALLQARLVVTTGLVELLANASILVGKSSAKVVFNWSWSTDGKTWNFLPSTGYAQTSIAGLAAGSYQFRVSANVGKTVGEWSQPANLTIH